MSSQGLGHNFKTAPSGLIVPSSVWNATLHAADVTHEMVGPGDTTKFLRGDNPPTWQVPSGGTPSGAAGGDIAGTGASTYPNPTLTAITTAAGPVGSSSVAPIITIDAKGRVTALSSATISPAAGSGGALTLIADSTLGADAASFDFTSIAGTYSHLLLVCYLRSSLAATGDATNLRFNNDSSAIYYDEFLSGVNVTASAGNDLAQTVGYMGSFPGDTATALRFSAAYLLVPNYANTTNHKSYLSIGMSPQGTTGASLVYRSIGGVWAATAAVSRITIFGSANLRAGSRATLYGMG